MNPQHRPEQGIAVTIGLMLLGIIVCFAWMFASAPAAVPLVAERITGAHFALLGVLMVVGLIATSICARVAVACVQLLFLITKIALLALVVVAGVFAWRWASAHNLQELIATPRTGSMEQTQVETVDPPPPVVIEDPEERRRQLEAQLLQLDRDSGKSWWGK